MKNLPTELDNPEPFVPKPENTFWNPFSIIAVLFALMMGATLLFGLVIPLITQLLGLDTEKTIATLQTAGVVNDPIFMRTLLFFNHLFMFILPALGVAAIVANGKMFDWLGAAHEPRGRDVFWGVVLLLASIPLVQVLYWFNSMIPLPAALAKLSGDNDAVLKLVLQSDNVLQSLGILVIVAVIPAIGEEFVFRGILQRQMVALIKNNPHLAIWLTAAIFSAIHLQFEGFLPRMILGAVLGYLFYWTKNIWVGAAAHFFNNALQLAVYFQSPDSLDTNKSLDDMSRYWYVALPAAVLSALAMFWVSKRFTQSNPATLT